MPVTRNEVPFLGTGWRFPLRVDGNGGLTWSSASAAVCGVDLVDPVDSGR